MSPLRMEEFSCLLVSPFLQEVTWTSCPCPPLSTRQLKFPSESTSYNGPGRGAGAVLRVCSYLHEHLALQSLDAEGSEHLAECQAKMPPNLVLYLNHNQGCCYLFLWGILTSPTPAWPLCQPHLLSSVHSQEMVLTGRHVPESLAEKPLCYWAGNAPLCLQSHFQLCPQSTCPWDQDASLSCDHSFWFGFLCSKGPNSPSDSSWHLPTLSC